MTKETKAVHDARMIAVFAKTWSGYLAAFDYILRCELEMS